MELGRKNLEAPEQLETAKPFENEAVRNPEQDKKRSDSIDKNGKLENTLEKDVGANKKEKEQHQTPEEKRSEKLEQNTELYEKLHEAQTNIQSKKQPENIEDRSSSKTKLEDMNWKDIHQMQEKNPEKLQSINKDYQERISAEGFGMSVEEYRAHLDRIEKANEPEESQEETKTGDWRSQMENDLLQNSNMDIKEEQSEGNSFRGSDSNEVQDKTSYPAETANEVSEQKEVIKQSDLQENTVDIDEKVCSKENEEYKNNKYEQQDVKDESNHFRVDEYKQSERKAGDSKSETSNEEVQKQGFYSIVEIDEEDKQTDFVSLENKLGKIKDDAYENRNSEGNMTLETKKQLVDTMKKAYDDTPKEERGDILVPEKPEFLKDPPIAENKNTGKRYGDVNYDWPSNGGFEGKPEEIIPQVGEKFDRVGTENGRYVTPLEGDAPQPVEKRALPYHFAENNITDEPSYHSYEVDRNFGQLQDAIIEYNNPKLTPEENEFMRSEFQKEYDRNNWSTDEYTHEPGKTYYGGIAEAFGTGGGTQLELPMAISSLKELGMIHER